MVPPGMVTTYGRIATAAGGGPVAARSVTSILGKAYMAGQKNIPFHRIVYTNGKVWLDDAYKIERLKLYKKEGIVINEKGIIEDFRDKLFEFA